MYSRQSISALRRLLHPGLELLFFQLVKNICLFSPVGFGGNLPLLEILLFSRGLMQMEAFYSLAISVSEVCPEQSRLPHGCHFPCQKEENLYGYQPSPPKKRTKNDKPKSFSSGYHPPPPASRCQDCGAPVKRHYLTPQARLPLVSVSVYVYVVVCCLLVCFFDVVFVCFVCLGLSCFFLI